MVVNKLFIDLEAIIIVPLDIACKHSTYMDMILVIGNFPFSKIFVLRLALIRLI